MHKGHLLGCAAGLALALGVVAVTGGSASGFGVLAAALVCPIAMVGAMWLLMGGRPGGNHRAGVEAGTEADHGSGSALERA